MSERSEKVLKTAYEGWQMMGKDNEEKVKNISGIYYDKYQRRTMIKSMI